MKSLLAPSNILLISVPSLRDCNDDIKQDIETAEDQQEVKPKLEVGTEDWLNGAEARELLKQTMDGFLLVLSHEGDITYVSENVVEYLGITKVSVSKYFIEEDSKLLSTFRRLTHLANRSGSTRTSAITPRSRRLSA